MTSLVRQQSDDERPLLTRYTETIGNDVHRDTTFRPLTVGLTATYQY